MTKALEKERARQMRHQGMKLQDIADRLGVSKSSVSLWTRDIELSHEDYHAIMAGARVGNDFRRRHAQEQRQLITDNARQWLLDVQSPPHLVFAALYWGEGLKNKNSVAVGSSDQNMIHVFVDFLRQHCDVDESRLHGQLHIHPDCDLDEAVKFWEYHSKITSSQWTKHQVVIPKSSKQVAEHRCPHGTFRVSYHDTNLRSQIEGWMQAIGYGTTN